MALGSECPQAPGGNESDSRWEGETDRADKDATHNPELQTMRGNGPPRGSVGRHTDTREQHSGDSRQCPAAHGRQHVRQAGFENLGMQTYEVFVFYTQSLSFTFVTQVLAG